VCGIIADEEMVNTQVGLGRQKSGALTINGASQTCQRVEWSVFFGRKPRSQVTGVHFSSDDLFIAQSELGQIPLSEMRLVQLLYGQPP
jgi:hypothetical protein